MTTTQQLPLILDEVEVVSIERLSPSFVRVELGGPALADFGVDGPLLDQRIKLVFPGASGRLPSFAGADDSWWDSWLQIPEDERGHMRTYTIREVRGSGLDTRLVVDLVLHLAADATGPGSLWAAKARVGDRLVVMAPRRGVPYGGIEYDAAEAGRVLLVGDETAVPAVCSILRDLPADARGAAFVEVPVAADIQHVPAPVGVSMTWLPRDGAPLGARLTAAVMEHLGAPPVAVSPVDDADQEVDPDLWETPTYSSSGEGVEDPESLAPAVGAARTDLDDLYAWIAGESGVVTGLRRHLVRDLGMHRRRVAFMGYWRRGVAMRS